MATAQHHYSAEENVVFFFRHVKRDLGIYSTRKIVGLVGQVLYHLRLGMSVHQAISFLNQLPGLFQLLFINHWKGITKNQKSYSHLDELVDRIYKEDRTSAHSFFGSEVEALNAVVVILKKLDSYLNLSRHEILNYPLAEELRQIHL